MVTYLSRRDGLKLLGTTGVTSIFGGCALLGGDRYYDGQSARADWRTAAIDRIDTYRTAPLTVRVRDEQGNPVPDAEVSVEMMTHAFGFGSAVRAPTLVSESPTDEQYRETVRRYFNKATIENGLKWPAWAGEWGDDLDRSTSLAAIQWLVEENIPIRGHTLIWPSYEHVPESIEAVTRDDPAHLHELIIQHIHEELGTLSDQITEWDVVNEPTETREFIDMLGQEAITDWLTAARETAPDASLFINDYAPLEPTDSDLPDRFYDLIEWTVANDAPLDGIGIQAHFSGDWALPPADVLDAFDTLSQFGLELQLTEFDFTIDRSSTSQREFQEAYTRDLLIAAYSHPAITAFIFWGFWAGNHRRPSAALFDTDWTLRPNGQVFLDLVYDQWWTSETGRTGSDGTFTVTGYKGDYLIRTTKDNRREVATTRLTGEQSAVDITL